VATSPGPPPTPLVENVTARSSLPSALKSPTAIDEGNLWLSIAGDRTGDWKVPSPFPNSVTNWFSSGFTEAKPTRSVLPSLFKSAVTKNIGLIPWGLLMAESAWNVPSPFPRRTVIWLPLQEMRSGFPSPLKSPVKFEHRPRLSTTLVKPTVETGLVVSNSKGSEVEPPGGGNCYNCSAVSGDISRRDCHGELRTADKCGRARVSIPIGNGARNRRHLRSR
jgi:hypothetical protein